MTGKVFTFIRKIFRRLIPRPASLATWQYTVLAARVATMNAANREGASGTWHHVWHFSSHQADQATVQPTRLATVYGTRSTIEALCDER